MQDLSLPRSEVDDVDDAMTLREHQHGHIRREGYEANLILERESEQGADNPERKGGESVLCR